MLQAKITPKEFLTMCNEPQKSDHRKLKKFWKGPDSEHDFDVLWDMFFEASGKNPKALLNYLSFLEIDSIPQEFVYCPESPGGNYDKHLYEKISQNNLYSW
jgi:hypothetical protein